MPFRNKVELLESCKDGAWSELASDLFVARTFLTRSIKTASYSVPESFQGLVKPSPAGQACLDHLASRMPHLAPAEALFAIFLDFYHQDLLVDVKCCNPEGLLAYLNDDILSNRIKFPWVYERSLYDKFNALFPNKTDSLGPLDTELLLKDTPDGVFQLSNIVVGPFGVLTSATERELRPILSPPLWHCSDPVCQNLHGVELESAVLPFRDAIREIDRFCSQELGPASEWPDVLSEFRDKRDWYDHLHPASLPWLLINGIVAAELRLLVGRLFDARSLELRSRLPQTKRTQALLSAPPSSIASRLDIAQLFQIILLLPDDDVVYFLEELIEDSRIVIPPAEIRETRFCASPRGWFDVSAQCSSLGVRFFSNESSFGMRHLRSVVSKVYDDPDEQKALAWKLRRNAGATPEERLAAFLYQSDLGEVVSALFFDDPVHLEAVFSALKFGKFAIPDGVAGTRKRVATAERHVASFSVATECGFGRRDPQTIPELLRIHAEIAG